MAKNISPKNTAIEIPENKLLVSKSNAEGIITYCNSDFIKLFGFNEPEIIAQPYTILRHPDMPLVIFKQLWETVLSNREFNGYLKNISKDGQYCWAFVNITPSYGENNELIGFYSVYRKPDSDKLNYIQNLYLELKEIEDSSQISERVSDSQFKLDSVLNGREVGYDEFILTL